MVWKPTYVVVSDFLLFAIFDDFACALTGYI